MHDTLQLFFYWSSMLAFHIINLFWNQIAFGFENKKNKNNSNIKNW